MIPFLLTERLGLPESDGKLHESQRHSACDLMRRFYTDKWVAQFWTTWMFSGLGIGLLVGGPTFGWFSDHSSSRRLPFLTGLVILLAGTAMLAFGMNIATIVAARILQGLSASIVFTSGLALISDTVDAGELGEYMGYFSLSSNMYAFKEQDQHLIVLFSNQMK